MREFPLKKAGKHGMIFKTDEEAQKKMKDMMRETVKKINKIGARISEDHIGAYAAQSAYFLMLSLIPAASDVSDTRAVHTAHESGCDCCG